MLSSPDPSTRPCSDCQYTPSVLVLLQTTHTVRNIGFFHVKERLSGHKDYGAFVVSVHVQTKQKEPVYMHVFISILYTCINICISICSSLTRMRGNVCYCSLETRGEEARSVSGGFGALWRPPEGRSLNRECPG